MAQTTILATGTDSTLSAEFTIGVNERAKVGLFPAAGNLDVNAGAAVFKKAVRPVGYPNHNPLAGNGTETRMVENFGNGAEMRPVVWIADPGTYYVQRTQGASPAAFGVYVDVTSRYSG